MTERRSEDIEETEPALDAGGAETGAERPFVDRSLDDFDAPGEDGVFHTGGTNEGLRVNQGDAQGPS